MPGEAWIAIATVVVAIIGYIQFYLPFREKRRQAPPEPEPADPFRDKWFARIDELEAEVKAERHAKVECLVLCARLKTELKIAAKQRTSDAETIRRLRERVDRLERTLRGTE